MVEIISVNCQGIGDHKKRRYVFNYLRNYGANIYCLQDTLFVKEKENLIRAEWGYDCLSFSFSPKILGVCIWFNYNNNKF